MDIKLPVVLFENKKYRLVAVRRIDQGTSWSSANFFTLALLNPAGKRLGDSFVIEPEVCLKDSLGNEAWRPAQLTDAIHDLVEEMCSKELRSKPEIVKTKPVVHKPKTDPKK